MILVCLWICVTLLHISHTQDCDDSWFGPQCQYKRHCRRCAMDEGCPLDDLCDRGWFGPRCQYVDLVARSKSVVSNPDMSVSQLIDGDDQTCLMIPSIQDLKVTWDEVYHITWMRLYVSQPDLLPTFSINSRNIAQTWRSVRVTDRILDIQFDSSILTSNLTLSGRGVGHLCSLYVSGGRNIALKQFTLQSSTRAYEDVDLVSALAVDGNTNGYLRGRTKSCSSTKSESQNPTWELTFTSAKVVYQIILHNRDVEELQYRLKGFTLEVYDVRGTRLSVFTDTNNTRQSEYVITWRAPRLPVSRVKIQATSQLNAQNISEAVLALCEVEIFGDSICPPRTYGLDCELLCNCTLSGEECFVSTGGCPSGCNGDLCNQTCTEVLSETTLAAVILFVSVGLGIVCIIILVVVICWCRKRRMRKTLPREYDMVDTSTQYNHQYKGLTGQGTSNGEIRHQQPQIQPQTMTQTSVASYDSKLYEEIDKHEYVEMADAQEASN